MPDLAARIVDALNAQFSEMDFGIERDSYKNHMIGQGGPEFRHTAAITLNGRRILSFTDLEENGHSYFVTRCTHKGQDTTREEAAYLLGTALKANGMSSQYEVIRAELKLPEISMNAEEFKKASHLGAKDADEQNALARRVAALWEVLDKPADMGWAMGKQRDDYIIVGRLNSHFNHVPLAHGLQSRSVNNPNIRTLADFIAALPEIEDRYALRLQARTAGRQIDTTELIADVLKRYTDDPQP